MSRFFMGYNLGMQVFQHQPVLIAQTLDVLAPQPGNMVLDCTVGGAGHAAAFLERVGPSGFLHGLDQDAEAIEAARKRLSQLGLPFSLHQVNFAQMSALQLPLFDVILMDLGVSSHQLDCASRGFSFQRAGPIDMRMNPLVGESADQLLLRLTENELATLFKRDGEERYAFRVARALVQRREQGLWFEHTLELAEFIRRLVPPDVSGIHPATRVFQALRIAVNDELGVLERVLPQAVAQLKPGGRLGVISFHSLEDRRVKQFFRRCKMGCVCPPRQPVCTCGEVPTLSVVTSKPLVADQTERNCNPRARSAKLRVARRLG